MCSCNKDCDILCNCSCHRAELNRHFLDAIASNNQEKFIKCAQLSHDIDNGNTQGAIDDQIHWMEILIALRKQANEDLTSNMSCTD